MEKKAFFVCCRNLVLSVTVGLVVGVTPVTHAGIASKQTPARVELLFWSAVENSVNPEELEAYIEEFPEGRFVRLAQVRANALRRIAPEITQTPVAQEQSAVDPTVPKVHVVLEPERVTVSSSSSISVSSGNVHRPAVGVSTARKNDTGTPKAGSWKRGGWQPESTEIEIVASEVGDEGSVNTPSVAAPGAWKRGGWKAQKRFAGATAAAIVQPGKPDQSQSTGPVLAAAMPTARAFTVFDDCADCPEMVSLNPGIFTMGSNYKQDRAKPPHKVKLDYPFSISRYEITTAQWNYCVDQGGCTEIAGNRSNDSDRIPANHISYRDAQDYVRWISGLTGNQYRLPSEVEWEYAARGGTSSDYWWGDTEQEAVANCRGCGGYWNDTIPANVDEFPANPFGLFATSGGVSEWTRDCWNSSEESEGNCKDGVLRGGSWKNSAEYLRSATRMKFHHDVRYSTNGFRVVRIVRK
ncbi:hypothetical protein AB833_29560 [Chromatiales bacterium (ex Bugula neritina AB1)]|nr:hypothetical protein AB833_29560 [Chromatiales bacterium (ex Bugula neritina AB1)]